MSKYRCVVVRYINADNELRIGVINSVTSEYVRGFFGYTLREARNEMVSGIKRSVENPLKNRTYSGSVDIWKVDIIGDIVIDVE